MRSLWKFFKVGIWLKEIRVIHWVKNLLVFVPVIASHKQITLEVVSVNLKLFFALSLSASCIYLMNDVLDLDSDKSHSIKKNRPLAAGLISSLAAKIVALVFLFTAMIFSYLISVEILTICIVYISVNVLYSTYLKKQVMLDVFILTFFYTLRIIAGGVANDVIISNWLLGFAFFLFLSLALSKRFRELINIAANGITPNSRRGYKKEDLPTLQILSISSGFTSLTILLIYLNDEQTRVIYNHPDRLLLLVPILMYWLSSNWFESVTVSKTEDPILDLFSRVRFFLLFPIAILVLILATQGN
jgi:4-hydroxybenzoate polyprenyltransferase